MKSNVITFERFQKIYEMIRKTVTITNTLFKLNDAMEEIPESLYVEIIRLHNAAVDYMEAYKKYVEFKEVI